VALAWHPHPGPQEAFHRSPAFEVLYGGAAGGGKFLSAETPVWTDSGWKTIGTLVDRDLVVAEDGTWSEFEYISDVLTNRKCYGLTFSNGEVIVADSTHLWNVIESVPYSKQHRHCIRYNEGTFTTEQLVAKGVRVKMSGHHSADGTSKRFRLPIVNGCDGVQQNLLVDPYVLGYWLGDGSVHSGYFAIGDQDLDEVVQIFLERGHQLVKLSSKYTYKSLNLRFYDLVELSVTRDHYETRETQPEVKHIPLQYLQASRQQRMELLRGLMDSDGYCQERGRCEIGLTETRLADDVCTLIASLGFKYARCVAPSSYNGKPCPSHRITFTPRVRVFNIKRKGRNQILTPPNEHDIAVWIETIEETESVPVQCIRIKHPSHTFLIGRSMIPTHNSESLLIEALRYVHVPGYTAVLFRRTFKELSQPKGLIHRARDIFPLLSGKYNEQRYEWRFEQSNAIIIFSHMEHLADRESHRSAEYAFIGFDELTTFEQEQYDFLKSRCRTTAVDPRTQQVVPARVRAGSNPGGPGHEWVKKRWAPWLDSDYSGVKAKPNEVRYFRRDIEKEEDVECGPDHEDALSRQFIPANLYDNPTLMRLDPMYELRLKSLPLLEREQLLNANWDILVRGNVFKPDWFKVIPSAPEGLRWHRYYDLAASVKTAADFTASAAVATDKDANIYVRDMINVKMEWPDAEKLIVRTVLNESWVVEHGIEKKMHGLAAFQILIRRQDLVGHRIVAVDVDGDKLSRALSWSSPAEQGKVYLVAGSWCNSFINQCSLFDGSGKTHDDMVDTVSGGVKMAANPRWRTIQFKSL